MIVCRVKGVTGSGSKGSGTVKMIVWAYLLEEPGIIHHGRITIGTEVE